MDNTFVIDIGGTKTTLALVTGTGTEINVLDIKSFSTFINPGDQIQKIHEIYFGLKIRPEVMSLSLPGNWNKQGILKESNFLNQWLNFPFITELSNELKISKYIYETDVICSTLGEYNALKESNLSLLYMNLGTGIGAGFIGNDGKPFKSLTRPTLRIQKLVVPYQEEIFSGVDLIYGGSLTQFSRFGSVEALYAAYKKANIEAIDIISRSQVQLAAWIINLFYLLAPDVIVVGGGLTYDWDVLAGDAIDMAYEELSGEVKILPSILKELAPIHGAYLNCHQQVYKGVLT